MRRFAFSAALESLKAASIRMAWCRPARPAFLVVNVTAIVDGQRPVIQRVTIPVRRGSGGVDHRRAAPGQAARRTVASPADGRPFGDRRSSRRRSCRMVELIARGGARVVERDAHGGRAGQSDDHGEDRRRARAVCRRRRFRERAVAVDLAGVAAGAHGRRRSLHTVGDRCVGPRDFGAHAHVDVRAGRRAHRTGRRLRRLPARHVYDQRDARPARGDRDGDRRAARRAPSGDRRRVGRAQRVSHVGGLGPSQRQGRVSRDAAGAGSSTSST